MSIDVKAAAAQNGDKAACTALWEAVRRFGLSIVRRYGAAAEANGAANSEDLEQIAALAMLEALKTWRKGDGTSFVGWYRYYIQHEAASALGWSGRHRVEHYQKISLATPVGDEADGLTLADTLADETLPAMTDIIERDVLKRNVHSAIERLPADEAACVRLHDLQGVALELVGISDARRTRRRALDRMRKDARLRLCASYYTSHKGVTAFKTTFSSEVEDAVIRLTRDWRANDE